MRLVNGKNGSFRRLVVYQRMLELVVLVYDLTKLLPDSEKFGLVSQMRRAAVSVLSNFTEGYAKSSRREKVRFLEIAATSLVEVEAQADVCEALGYWDKGQVGKFFDKKREVGYLLHRYVLKVKQK